MLIKTKKSKLIEPKDVHQILISILKAEDELDRDKEHFWVFGLDSRNTIKYLELVSLGTLNSNLVHPREVFRRAVKEGVGSVLLAHNHPSDETEPSEADLVMTNRLKKAGKILGIEVTDHIIVTDSNYFSFRAEGVI